MSLSQSARRFLAAALLVGAASAAFGQMMPPPPPPPPAVPPGPFDRTWDWWGPGGMPNRNLKFCIDGGTPALLASAARFAASNLDNAGFGWHVTETLNAAGAPIACPAGWNLRVPIAGQADIRVRAAKLGVIAAPAGPPPPPTPYWPYPVDRPRAPSYNPYDYPWERKPNPNDQPPGGGGGMPGPPAMAGGPPLAYFQPGPAAGRLIRSAEIVYNSDVLWNILISTFDFDPRDVGMHEFGHAIRMDHDPFRFDDDDSYYPVGSQPPQPPPPGGPVPVPPRPQDLWIVGPGADGVLQTRRLGDDGLLATWQITVGANLQADSGKKMNVMEPDGVRGQHGINPLLGFPPGSAYSYTDREQSTGRASAMPPPPPPPPKIQIAGGLARFQTWGTLSLYGAGHTLLTTYSPGTVDGDPATDYLVSSVPPATRFEASVSASSLDVSGTTQVTIAADLGAAPSGTTVPVQVYVPLSPNHASLTVTANWAADTVSIADGPTVLCSGALSSFHPIDCAANPSSPDFFSVGIVRVELTNTAGPTGPTSPKP